MPPSLLAELPRRRFIAAATMSGMALISCARKPQPPSPETRHQLYDKAWQWGRRDRLLGLAASSARYRERLAQHQPPFASEEMQSVLDKGYTDGYDQHPEEEMALDESAYDKGYRQGQLDAFAGHSEQNHEPGYQDGYKRHPHIFKRPY
jgi:hypothetical protein